VQAVIGSRIVTGALTLLAGLAAAPAADAERGRTWYVAAGGANAGTGSRERPFDSLERVERASRRSDRIVVLRSGRTLAPLDGGIALKRDQRLVGGGPPLASATTPRPRAARITNTRPERHDGDAVVLADGAVVRNLEIVAPLRGGIYGKDVSGVRIRGNRISGHNSSCAEGFHIPPFVAATNVPGVGIPISEGLANGWAAIMLDAERRRRGLVTIRRNVVHDADCGDGIDIRLAGSARYRARLSDNVVSDLAQGEDFESLLAIGLQADDHSRLIASLDRNRQTRLGNPADPNLAVFGADTEGIFVNPVGHGRMRVDVDRNTYTNPDGLGGFSANGMEMVSMGDGSRGRMVIRRSHFSGSPGDILEVGGLGTNADLSLKLVDVVAERSTGVGNTLLIPFNNADCLLAGSLGAGNSIRLTIRDSVLSGCANNGLSLGSNAVNGSGPTTRIHADIRRTEITANRGANLGIRNFTGLDELAVRVEGSNLSDSRGIGSGVANFAAENLGTTVESAIDLGGGTLGSAGGNCIEGGILAADVVRYDVSAEDNWWGSPSGAAPGRVLALGGELDIAPFRSAPPPSC
jgi:hypothetical protein